MTKRKKFNTKFATAISLTVFIIPSLYSYIYTLQKVYGQHGEVSIISNNNFPISLINAFLIGTLLGALSFLGIYINYKINNNYGNKTNR